ncbi:hypothetical protein F5Y19DRAFT_153695 [Xylariaceae sp. FL1651]|nr:hypothetical protein F5Y19DRAFT_153695 [Xylariaceae sp. FL1651]
MASTFRPVNSPMTIEIDKDDGIAPSPTTPTPTKATFGQRPLPTSPFPQAVQIPESIEENKTLQRENSQRSRKSRGDSEDVDMDESDGEAQGNEDGAGSDDESVNADGTKSSKKKKSQRFYCTDYPPCNLSFTRSEHLARHIRKHTGERPFQCHCSRRFSRLDNLRQHAQTVHVNEDIPIDSLAATGTRFQRQIRTDRVRQPGRARASTAGSMGAPARGHSKSLSTSSISSVGSNFSAREDVRRRPPPLVMADPRFQYTSEGYPYRPPSPSDFSTPTSATFSTGQNSPRWGSIMASPTSSQSRSHSLYAGSRTPGRRLSVPSGATPFQSPHSANPGRPVFGSGPPGAMSGSNPAAYSPVSSVLASPTSTIFSRRESASGNEEWRRRTWHPDSSNFNAGTPGSRLSNVITPSQYPSSPSSQVHLPVPQPQPNSTLRLPGIESFGPLPNRPASPMRRNASPMMVDSEVPHPPALLPSTNPVDSEEKRNTVNWDMGLHRGLTRLDIASSPATQIDSASSWAREANQAMDAQADRVRLNPPTVRFHEPIIDENVSAPIHTPSRTFHQYTMSAPSIASSRESKRRGWYQGPVSIHADAPPEKIARVERMIHPNISEFSGFPARDPPSSGPTSISREENPGEKEKMLRLQALVAVATSEGNATTAY